MGDENDLLFQMIGERIRAAREELRNVSQERLGEAVGLTRTSINNIENGRQRLTIHTLWRIAAATGTEARLLIPLSAEYEREQAGPAETVQTLTALAEEAHSGNAQARQQLRRITRRFGSHRRKLE